MDKSSQQKWNNIYSEAEPGLGEPVWVLQAFSHLLPKQGKALDLACGLAANGFFLASHGLAVEAWDISDVVVEKLNLYAQTNNVHLSASVHDFTNPDLGSEQYDVIVVAHFLERSLAPLITNALKPGGLLFYQTFVKDVTPDYSGPGNPDFRLDTNELLQIFSDLQVVQYREEATIGDLNRGLRNAAAFIGRKRAP